MSTYVRVDTDAADAPQASAFTSALMAMPELGRAEYGTMPADTFADLVDDALDRLYASDNWAEYVASGQRDIDQARLAQTGMLVMQRSSAAAVERSLVAARTIAEYAQAHQCAVRWG